ncbi:MAG: hypothetical protein LPK26_04345 [Bacillaceae bacterium]|uniref:Uncharacterized protein n=1 Tax=Alkalihalobacterium chitinilyticum TaxID=2980103 RepID=A0ABT5V9U2_9BACI|nr:hypothetical protein [Alkalihalobacterium chitinilyticum]MDE5412233.1 hypothetical protein [Alkalihalobacterium chitinilyticum]MEB1806530.1 hypothetical protein [Bacillaceae bacterium]
MFQFLHEHNDREVYQAEYCDERFLITYNSETDEIEHITPMVGTDAIVRLFKNYRHEQK